MEFKISKKWKPEWNNNLVNLRESKESSVKKTIGVYLGEERLTSKGVSIYPVEQFLKSLYAGEFF